jgi:hypothetical protein
MFLSDWSALMTPQKTTLDSKRTLSRFVSYQRLSPQFQFSLSGAALDMYPYDVHIKLYRDISYPLLPWLLRRIRIYINY